MSGLGGRDSVGRPVDIMSNKSLDHVLNIITIKSKRCSINKESLECTQTTLRSIRNQDGKKSR